MKSSFVMKSLAVSLTSIALLACGGSDSSDDKSNSPQASAKDKVALAFTPKNLEPLGKDYIYEGWLLGGGKVIGTGALDIDANNLEKTINTTVEGIAAKDVTKFVLTIEPAGETGDAAKRPTAVHVVAGDILSGTGVATAKDSAAIGTDFSDAKGSYILAVPTDKDAKAKASNGIWYLKDENGSKVASLELPDLPPQWEYEGWVVGESGPVSTGKFSKPAGKDSDGAGKAAGQGDAPPFPGQDFVDPAMELVGKTAVISVEPKPDNSDKPFSIKPLSGKITLEEGKMVLENNAAKNIPTAQISVSPL